MSHKNTGPQLDDKSYLGIQSYGSQGGTSSRTRVCPKSYFSIATIISHSKNAPENFPEILEQMLLELEEISTTTTQESQRMEENLQRQTLDCMSPLSVDMTNAEKKEINVLMLTIPDSLACQGHFSRCGAATVEVHDLASPALKTSQRSQMTQGITSKFPQSKLTRIGEKARQRPSLSQSPKH